MMLLFSSYGVLFVALAFFGGLSLAASKPNILVILTDDQDLHLDSLSYMDSLQSKLVQQGTLFNKHYGHVSQCCPARMTLWSGKHAHNTNVTSIYNGMAGGGWQQIQKLGWYKKHLFVWLQKLGYDTYYSGKLFNGFDTKHYCDPVCVQGFTKADIFLDPTTYYYYNTKYAHYNGHEWSKTDPSPDYSTDVIADNVANFIDESAKSGNPFFAVAAPTAPHIPAFPRRDYRDLYPDIQLPKSPNFNTDNRTGVGIIWAQDQLDDETVADLTNAYRKRIQSLKSVDELVEKLVGRLEETGTLDNTYIFYTSDNGYHMGNHRMHGGKFTCFEEDINIPLIIRGPDVGKDKKSDLVTGHIDIAPTILRLAGANDSLQVQYDLEEVQLDGTAISFPLENDADTTRNEEARGETTHLEFWGPFFGEWAHHPKPTYGPDQLMTYKALRLQGQGYSLLYSVWCQGSAHELYDMTWDPYQISNLHPDAPSEGNGTNAYNQGMTTMYGYPIQKVIQRLDALVLVLKTCVGDQCRWPWHQLHSSGKVKTFTDAMNEQYDQFYTNSYKVAKVGWDVCYSGYDEKHSSTLYSLDNEEPNWSNEAVVKQVTGGSNSINVPGKRAMSVLALVIYLTLK